MALMFPCDCWKRGLNVFFWHSFSLLLIAAVVGCSPNISRPNAEPVFPVEGRLFVGGSPAAGAKVSFHSNRTSSIIMATVQVDGRFVPAQSDGAIGLAEGTYSLTATWPDGETDRLAGKYIDQKKPITQVNVVRGMNLLPPINLP